VIILVEDDADQRLSLKLALELSGFAVREAANGREALALQRERAARILITDIFMPESDGFELIDTLRKEFPQTKIVAVSGGGHFAKADYLSQAKLIGADATLQKPFEIEALVGTLRALQAGE
jgi:DNA-binding response OmpR family regulator